MNGVSQSFYERQRDSMNVIKLGYKDGRFYDPEDPYYNQEYLLNNMCAPRQEMLEGLEQNRDGIDTEGVEAFFRSQGLVTEEYVIIDLSQLDKCREIAKKHGWAAFPKNEDEVTYGVTLPGIAVVLRDPQAERENGVAFTEGLLAHELGHTTHKWNEWIGVYRDGPKVSAHIRNGLPVSEYRRKGKTMYAWRRTGFSTKGYDDMPGSTCNHHSFLEEGFAGLKRAECLKALGKECVGITYAEYAAEGLQLLVNEMPEFSSALIEARTSVSGLRKVARMIDSVKPGLYSKLGKLDYTKEDFIVGTEMIEKALAEKALVI